MLRDRRELVEHEVEKLKTQAAELYLSMIKHPDKVHGLRDQYDWIRNQIIEFEFDLNTINELIEQGHK